MLGVLAYPGLKDKDFQLIQDFRKNHDELYYAVAEPHFAFVFPLNGIGEKRFIDEIILQSAGKKHIDFDIKCATINMDAFLDYYHLLLVPDIGYSDIVKLHDQLYSGSLAQKLRLDIDFIPHMGIGNSRDGHLVKKLVDAWNAFNFSIKGRIENLTIIRYTNNVLTNLEEIRLD